MQDNTPNNWKHLLESPDSFPGEIIKHKNEAWENLYQRLHKKPGRKLTAWYWAAASLVVAMAAVGLFINKQTNPPAVPSKLVVITNQIPPPAANSLQIDQKNTGNRIAPAKQKTHRAPTIQKNSFAAAISVNNNFIADSVNKPLPQLVIASTASDSQAIKNITLATPPKKKLRVVHVNEIGQPGEESTVNNKFRERHSFGFRVTNGEIFNPVYGSSTNNGLILTKRTTSN